MKKLLLLIAIIVPISIFGQIGGGIGIPNVTSHDFCVKNSFNHPIYMDIKIVDTNGANLVFTQSNIRLEQYSPYFTPPKIFLTELTGGKEYYVSTIIWWSNILVRTERNFLITTPKGLLSYAITANHYGTAPFVNVDVTTGPKYVFEPNWP